MVVVALELADPEASICGGIVEEPKDESLLFCCRSRDCRSGESCWKGLPIPDRLEVLPDEVLLLDDVDADVVVESDVDAESVAVALCFACWETRY